MAKILITTVPFGTENTLPIELLENHQIDYIINPLGRKLNPNELIEMVHDCEVIIAGTEKIPKNVLKAAKNLKLISRVGVGLDGIDLNAAKELDIAVSYTPEAPAPAVAELTIGMMLSLLRNIHVANDKMHKGEWNRYFGKRISEITVGIIGTGRIGGRVIRRISAFGSPRILANDLNRGSNITDRLKIEWVDKEKIFRESDLVTIHLPLTIKTKNLITRNELALMKPDAVIINTSRGGIINEQDLYEVLTNGHLAGAAIDVFEKEPYEGNLKEVQRCLLTCHMGSMSKDCRSKMEIEATEEAIRLFTGAPLKNLVPTSEYIAQTLE
jgi:D-3-phosphoglycerate dehydrogenase / 2-oxoglutarate reductase